MHPGLDLPVLSVKTGDLIKIIRPTDFHNIAYGELICQGDESRAAEMVQRPMSGCFITLRCTFAEGQAPDPKPSAPGGAQDPLGLFCQRPKLVRAKREPEPDTKKPAKLTPNQVAALNRWDEPTIKELIQQGFSAEDFEKRSILDTSNRQKTELPEPLQTHSALSLERRKAK